MASTAHAQDWLAGEYEVAVPDHPAPNRFVLVITRDAEGRYRDEVFAESVDASTGRILKRLMPQPPGADAGVRVLTASEMATPDWPDLAAANVRCASVDGMLLCHVPDGASVAFCDQTLRSGYFGGAMHVGLIEVRKRPAGAIPQAAAAEPPASR
jgi:hypothetical protein